MTKTISASKKNAAGGVTVGAVKRRRTMPFLAIGLVLVLAGALGFAYLATRLGDRTLVLAVARPVAAGATIQAGDLASVSAAQDSGLRLIPAMQKDEVVGRTAAVPLVAGSLLVPGQLGKASFPPAGQASATLALKAGQFPAGLAAGAHVMIYIPVTKDSSSVDTAPRKVTATVVSVGPSASEDGALVSLVLSETDAPALAGGTSSMLVVQVAGSNR